MEIISANIGAVRRERLNGRDYLVAPVTMIVPGVLNGSKGALYYPDDEVSRDPQAWNGMPIVAPTHPVDNGNHVSARRPDILEKQGIGNVYNAVFDGKLTAEGWFDVEATQRVDNRIYEALKAGKQLELSTGLFTENEPASAGATHNGKAYSYIARNYRPDHLAILPDAAGACSVSDGCGVNVNAEAGLFKRFISWLTANAVAGKNRCLNTGKYIFHGLGTDRVEVETKADDNPDEEEESVMNREQTITFLTTNCDCWKGKEKVLANKEAFTDDDLSKLKANAEKSKTDALVANAAAKGFKSGNRVFKLDAASGKFVANAYKKECDPEMEDCEDMAKKPAANGFDGKDADGHGCEEDDDDCRAAVAIKQREGTNNQRKAPMTEAEWYAAAPPSIRERDQFAKRLVENQKQQMVARLTAHIADPTRRQQLTANLLKKDLTDLQERVDLLPPVANDEQTFAASAPLYFGDVGNPTANRKDDSDNVLPTFAFNFEAPQKV